MIDLLISPCKQLLTLAGDNAKPRRGAGLADIGLVTDGAVGINVERGTIEYAGPRDSLPQHDVAQSCPVVDASNRVVLPGFVDSHTHLVFAGSRADEFYRRAAGESYQSIARSGGGIRKTMEATRAASADELLRLATWRMSRMVQNGTTAFEVKTGYGLEVESERVALGVIQQLKQQTPALVFATYLGAHLIPPEYTSNRAAYVDQVVAQLEAISKGGLADFYDIFVDPLAFTQAEAQRIVDMGKQTKLGLRLHGDEFDDNGTAAWGVSQGALSIDHLGGIGEGGIAALATSDTVATLLPATMFFSGHGKYAPARKMIEAGCAIALATDLNPGSSMVYSMAFTMTLAALKMGLSPEECIVASTINGAHALGAAKQTGSLEVGKRADVVILDIADYRELAYHVGAKLVSDVFINGQGIIRKGTLTPDYP